MFNRSFKILQRSRVQWTLGAATVTAGGLYLANTTEKKVHAESNQKLSFWEALPGENLPVNEGLAKLRGFAAEQRFRTALAQHNGKTDFDVVIGKDIQKHSLKSLSDQ
jgi:2-hydroxyglutarate dehydrogenase